MRSFANVNELKTTKIISLWFKISPTIVMCFLSYIAYLLHFISSGQISVWCYVQKVSGFGPHSKLCLPRLLQSGLPRRQQGSLQLLQGPDIGWWVTYLIYTVCIKERRHLWKVVLDENCIFLRWFFLFCMNIWPRVWPLWWHYCHQQYVTHKWVHPTFVQ